MQARSPRLSISVAPDPETPRPEEREEPPRPRQELGTLVERVYLIAAGTTSIVVAAVADAIIRPTGAIAESEDEEEGWVAFTAADFAGAGVALAIQAGAIAVRAGVEAGRLAAGLVSLGAGPFIGDQRVRKIEERVARFGGTERDDAVRAAEAFAMRFGDVLVPAVVGAVLDRIDLTDLIAERVDLDVVVSDLDVDRIVRRVDLAAVLDRLSIDEIAARLDVDAVAERLDIEAVVDRLDLVDIARRVIDELDLPEIVREATGTMSTETVDSLRVRGMNADKLFSRWRDRMLARGDDGSPTDVRGQKDGGS